MTFEGRPTHLKQDLRSELESARTKYSALLESVTDAQWTQPSTTPRWTIGGEFAHIALGLGTVPLRMESARSGKPIQWMEVAAFDSANTDLTRELASRYDRESVRPYFDDQYSAAVTLLESVEEHEWELVSQTYIQQWNVREIFANQVAHIKEHLGNAAAALAAS